MDHPDSNTSNKIVGGLSTNGGADEGSNEQNTLFVTPAPENPRHTVTTVGVSSAPVTPLVPPASQVGPLTRVSNTRVSPSQSPFPSSQPYDSIEQEVDTAKSPTVKQSAELRRREKAFKAKHTEFKVRTWLSRGRYKHHQLRVGLMQGRREKARNRIDEIDRERLECMAVVQDMDMKIEKMEEEYPEAERTQDLNNVEIDRAWVEFLSLLRDDPPA